MTRKKANLLRELFLMVRELMPPGEASNRRQAEWAAKFREFEEAHDGDDE